jgi:hypothetical protein
MTIHKIVQALTESRDSDAEMYEKIWSNADGRMLSMDEDSDQAYLEGKREAYDHALMLLEDLVKRSEAGYLDLAKAIVRRDEDV